MDLSFQTIIPPTSDYDEILFANAIAREISPQGITPVLQAGVKIKTVVPAPLAHLIKEIYVLARIRE